MRGPEHVPIQYDSRRSYENRDPRRPQSHRDPPEMYRASLRTSGDSSRRLSVGSTSKDSHFGGKEAMFEPYETDDVEPQIPEKQARRMEPHVKPSPGEGLRNALGKLENRLNRRPTDGQTDLPNNQAINNSQKSSSGKGLATLVEELVEPRISEKGIALEIGTSDGTENVQPSRERNSADLQRGLLSLLSHLNQSKPREPNHQRGGQVSSLPRPSEHMSASYRPILPSRQQLPKNLSEHSTLVAKYKFSTAGIPPLTQRTKHGFVKIDQNGYIELNLPSISQNTFSISPESTLVTVTDTGRIVWQGDVDTLPWRWTRVYRYASRFVRVCLARIPRASVEVRGVRGRVMLNGDFEGCNTQRGILIRRGAKQSTVKVYRLDEDVEELLWEGNISDIPSEWGDVLRSSAQLYSRCMAMDKDTPSEGGSEDTARCIPGVGWCTTRGPKVQLLFKDGVRIDLSVERRELLYCNKNGRKEKWPLHQDRLPRYITQRLDRCKEFAEGE